MARLRGAGLGAGMALGTAAVVRMRNGVPLMPEIPPRLAALLAQRRLTETPEVVVVAEDYRTAQAIASSISWAKVVGIVSERDDPGAPVPAVPAVTGLASLMRAAADDVLILVDATRGVALIDPDPIYLAQYTAEHDRIAPRNRVYLDDTHMAAQTIDGHAVSVVAITGGEGVEAALASGPDALYHALPLTFDPADLRRHLAEVAAVVAGKPLIVPYNPSLPLTPLMEAATQTDITLAILPPDDALIATEHTLAQVRQETEMAQIECTERDVFCSDPRLAVEISIREAADWPLPDQMASRIESAAAAGVTRLIVACPSDDRAHIENLVQLAAHASVSLMPITFYLSDVTLPPAGTANDDTAEFDRTIQLLIGAGVSGFLVAPERTQLTKAAIRASGSSECREELARWLRVD